MIAKTSKDTYAKYLCAYLSLLTDHSQNYMVSFSNVDREIFEALEGDASVLGAGVDVIYMENDDYAEAVGLRNDIHRKKFVILTAKSVKQIDSLKHFCEFPILPSASEDENSISFWDILKKMYGFKYIHKKNKAYGEFFGTILQYKQPSLAQLLHYAEESVIKTPRKNDLDEGCLNSNLNLLGCWRTNSDKLIPKIKLKKIIRSSEPGEIASRLENTSVKGIRSLKTIQRLIYRKDFAGVFERYDYTAVEPCFKGGPRRKNDPKQPEAQEEQWMFSYDGFLSNRDECDSIGAFEKDELPFFFEEGVVFASENGNQESEHPSLEEIQKRYDAYSRNLQLPGESYIRDLNDDILRQCANINNVQRQKIQNWLDALSREYESLLNRMRNTEHPLRFPFLLREFVMVSQGFASAYLGLLQFVFEDEHIAKILNEYGLIEKIQNIFVEQKNNVCLMPFYHPVFILHLCKLNKLYEELCEKIEGSAHRTEERLYIKAMELLKEDFPIRVLYSGGNLYQLESGVDNHPFFSVFSLGTNSGSVRAVDEGQAFRQIYRYINAHPYISQLKVLLIGDLNFDGLDRFTNQIMVYMESEKTLLDNLVLSLMPRDANQTKKKLDQNFSNKVITHKIQFHFVDKFVNMQNEFSGLSRAHHLIIFLDSESLYYTPYLQEVKTGFNSLIADVTRNTVDDIIDDLMKGNRIFPFLWEGLHNAILHNTPKLTTWNTTEIISAVLQCIVSAVDSREGFEAVILSSNTNIKNSIYLSEYLSLTSYDNRGSELVCLHFSKDNQGSYTMGESKLRLRCILPLQSFSGVIDKEMLDLRLSNDIYELERMYIRFSLRADALVISLLFPTEHKDKIDEEDRAEWKTLIRCILSVVYGKERGVFVERLRQLCTFQSYSYCRGYGDTFLCHYLSGHFVFDENTAVEIAFNDVKTSGAFDYFKARYFIEKFLNRDGLSEGSIKEFQEGFREPDFMPMVLQEAIKISGITVWYEEQMEKLIEGVDEYGQW